MASAKSAKQAAATAKPAGRKAKDATVKRAPAKGATPKRARTDTRDRPAPPGATSTPLYKELDAHVRRLFPGAIAMEAYGITGWTATRARRMETWKGTMDPNLIYIGLAERPAGTTLHFWNPFEPGIIRRHVKRLQAVGAKPMVGCIRYERKGPFPLAEVLPLLEDVARAARDEARTEGKIA